jgi:hypothetical protein
MKTLRIVLITLCTSMLALPASASDALIDGARLCAQHFPVQEREKNIPVHLLAAIASAESGRWHKGLGMPLPWPWTINVEGKGYYFGSKAEAIARTQQFMRQGKRSIDVGCMQVNLKHHAGAFATLDAAFDPQTNVSYAATFLRNNYDDLGDWIRASAAYHSRTPSLGRKYLARIEQTWNRIVSKVQAAQARQPGGYRVVNAQNPLQGASLQPEPFVASINVPAQNALPSTRGVKVISVRDEAPRESVLIVAPRAPSAPEDANAPVIAVASAEPASTSQPLANTAAYPTSSSFDNSNKQPHTQPKAQFVFTN